MTRITFIICVASAILGSLLITQATAQADESKTGTSVTQLDTSATLPAPPQWKATVSSSYFNLQGSKAANNDLYSFGDYTVAAQDMKLQYTIAPGWTVSVLAQYLTDSVVVNVGAASLPFKTTGLGDTWLQVAHPILIQGPFLISADAGVSLPTGSINEENPYGPMHDAYFIQLGSGTFDGLFGLTSMYRNSFFNVGDRLFTQVRTGDNANGYHLGNLYKAEGWLDVPLKYGFTPRVVGYYRVRAGITGWDYTLPRQPLTEYYYHNQNDWNVAAALRYEHPLWNRLSILAEADLPFYQGMSNSDNVAVRVNYYGTVSLNGQF
jgi:hypothetical protein